jgi:hypothetical protein
LYSLVLVIFDVKLSRLVERVVQQVRVGTGAVPPAPLLATDGFLAHLHVARQWDFQVGFSLEERFHLGRGQVEGFHGVAFGVSPYFSMIAARPATSSGLSASSSFEIS